MSYKSLSKEHVTESDIVVQAPIAIENIKWSALTSDQSVLKNVQRIVEDMGNVSTYSRVRVGCAITSTTDTIHLGSGSLMINGRWLRQAATEDFTTTQLSGTVASGDRMLLAKVLKSADNWGTEGNLREVENESFCLVEKALTDTIEDDELLLATYTRDGSNVISSITNIHTADYEEIRTNDIIDPNKKGVRIVAWDGTVLSTLTKTSSVFTQNVVLQSDLTVNGTLNADTISPDTLTYVNINSLKIYNNKLEASNGGYIDFDTSSLITISGNPIKLNNDTTINGTLNVSGNVTYSSDFTIGGILNVNTIDDNGNGSITFSSPIIGQYYSNESTTYPNVVINNGSLIAYDSSGNNKVQIEGDTGIISNYLSISNSLTVQDTAIFTVSGTANFSGTTTIHEAVFNGSSRVNDNEAFYFGTNNEWKLVHYPTDIDPNRFVIETTDNADENTYIAFQFFENYCFTVSSDEVNIFGNKLSLDANGTKYIQYDSTDDEIDITASLNVTGGIKTTTRKQITFGGFGGWIDLEESASAPNEVDMSLTQITDILFKQPFFRNLAVGSDGSFEMITESAFDDLTGSITLPAFKVISSGNSLNGYLRVPFRLNTKPDNIKFKKVIVGTNIYCANDNNNWNSSVATLKLSLYQWYANGNAPFYGKQVGLGLEHLIGQITQGTDAGWNTLSTTFDWNAISTDGGSNYILEIHVTIDNNTSPSDTIRCLIGRIVLEYEEKI